MSDGFVPAGGGGVSGSLSGPTAGGPQPQPQRSPDQAPPELTGDQQSARGGASPDMMAAIAAILDAQHATLRFLQSAVQTVPQMGGMGMVLQQLEAAHAAARNAMSPPQPQPEPQPEPQP